MSPMDSTLIKCAACLQQIKNRLFLKCCLCMNSYDIMCVNVSEERFYNTMTSDHKKQWQCQECKNKIPRGDNTDTPVKQSDIYVGTRKRANQKQTTSSKTSESVPNPTCDLIKEMRLLREEMSAVRNEMKEFRTTISGLTVAVELCNSRIDDMSVRIDTLEKRQQPMNGSLTENTISELRAELNDRDQALLGNDLEIVGIPEEASERTIHLVLSVANKLGVPMEERDLVNVERVGVRRRVSGEESATPRQRPLVVRLARRALRDQLLTAARVRRGATTDGLGLFSPVRPFYVNERLTTSNRNLFYKTRAEAAKVNWKYVWTRDGKIYARKDHGTVRHRLCRESDILKVFGGE
ncbi:hypothetical protein ACJJTC_009167 [Scirpophaga incertulas]